jgi:RimJ/RimL family protein N-acetyltransferase
MEYVIERASLDDTKAIHAYLNEIAAGKPDVLFLRPNGFPFDQVEKLIESSYESTDDLFLVAKTKSDILGTLTFSRYSKMETRHSGDFGMSVHPDHRRKGIGNRLIKELESWAQANGICKIELQVWSNNIPAIRLYEKLGYETEGVRKGAILRDGNRHDSILMGRFIGQPAFSAEREDHAPR